MQERAPLLNLRLTTATKMTELSVDAGLMGGQRDETGEGVGCDGSDQFDEKVLQL